MTAATLASPRRLKCATADPVRARDFLDQAYGGRLRLDRFGDTGLLVTIDRLEAGSFTVADVRLSADLTFRVAGQDAVGVNTLLAGGVNHDFGKPTHRYRPGDVFVGNHPHAELESFSHDAHLHTVTLSASLLTDVVGDSSVRPGGSWELLSPLPVEGGAARWSQTSRLVDGLLAEPETAGSALLLGPAARLLAATALTVFPNTLVAPPVPADRTDDRPGTLRRAIAFIEAQCDRDVSLADVARAACVTPRAVQLAFRRQLDTTPTAYLRTVRLAQAHQQLRDATPGDGTTVTAVAARWGFTPSRFTERYRAAYGVLPSRTLRT